MMIEVLDVWDRWTVVYEVKEIQRDGWLAWWASNGKVGFTAPGRWRTRGH